jgi:hypothetical protein
MSDVLVDFIAFNEERDACLMVLVEGPWDGDVDGHLRNLQDRMFGCLEAALDGQLAEQFPDARGKAVIVRVDCYDVPRDDVEGFVSRFAEGVANLPDYSTAASPFVGQFMFEANFDTLAANEPMSAIDRRLP